MSEKSSEEQIKPQGWLGLVLVRANTRDKIRLESWALPGVPLQSSLSRIQHLALPLQLSREQQDMRILLLLAASASLSLAGGIREKRQSYYGRVGGGYGGQQGRADVQVGFTLYFTISVSGLFK